MLQKHLNSRLTDSLLNALDIALNVLQRHLSRRLNGWLLNKQQIVHVTQENVMQWRSLKCRLSVLMICQWIWTALYLSTTVVQCSWNVINVTRSFTQMKDWLKVHWRNRNLVCVVERGQLTCATFRTRLNHYLLFSPETLSNVDNYDCSMYNCI